MATKSLPEPWTLLVLAASAPAMAQNEPGTPPADPATQPYIHPRNGQTEQQQWIDRYACSSWAKTQSGFDPANPAATSTFSEDAAHREQYRRALDACLEARGYDVSSTPPPVAAPPPLPVVHTPEQPTPLLYHGLAARHSASAPELKYHALSLQIEGGYTPTTAMTRGSLNGGPNAGLGLTWFPTPALPLGFRVDGSYSRFGETPKSLSQASQTAGTNVNVGNMALYGGDADAELDLRMGPSVKEYIFGGVGWYREQTTLKQRSYELGVGCFYYCFEGYFPVTSTVQQSTTGWLHSWNAGVGFEFALSDSSSFFIEARYLRVGKSSNKMEFIPIRIGFRF